MKIKKHVKPVVAVVALLAAIVGENLLRSKTHQFGWSPVPTRVEYLIGPERIALSEIRKLSRTSAWSPIEFIPLAEETGLIIPLGTWVLKETCRQAKEGRDRYPRVPPLVTCVNLSARQLEHPDIVSTIEETLRRTGLEPHSLILDITETTIIGESNTDLLNRLKDLGVWVSIDDLASVTLHSLTRPAPSCAPPATPDEPD